MKEETESEEEEVVAEGKKLKEMGHKDEMAMPKSKKEAMEMMQKEMTKMSAEDAKQLAASYMNKEAMTDEEVELEGLAKAKEAIEKRLASISVKEDVDALVEGEELSEEFKAKATTIFEAAVKSKIRPEAVSYTHLTLPTILLV